ncbi:MAG: serine hydrolase [Capsulimonadaceae bacterium]|nr:serine hydrolase [Capsulimonadaceae bacterium]
MPAASLPHSLPEAQSVSASAILSFVEALETTGLGVHSFMLLRHGHVVADGWWKPYEATTAHTLFSLTKSFMSTAVGLAISEGRLSLDDSVAMYFPDKLPAVPDQQLASLKVRHLLTMTTGQESDILGLAADFEADWVRDALAIPFAHEPGTTFAYSSTASHLAGAIVQRLIGQSLRDYLQPRLFGPLGISDVKWDECPSGVSIGGWGLSLRTEDIARFGQLYLQRGMWNGRRLIPEDWIDQATSCQVPNGEDRNSDWNQGYGFQFWRCRHNIYRGDGAFGQFCIVMPEQDAVLAITSGSGDLQGVLNAVWDHLLPGIHATDLAPEQAADEALVVKLSTLTAWYPQGNPTSRMAQIVNGRTYVMETRPHEPERVTFEFDRSGGAHCTLALEGEDLHVVVGGDRWTQTGLDHFAGIWGQVWARGTWVDEETYHERVQVVGTPFAFDLTCRFDDEGGVIVQTRQNVWFSPTETRTTTGKWKQA